MFAPNPTDIVAVIPQRSLIADAAIVGEDHAALSEQRAFDRPGDRSAFAHELEGLLTRFRIVIRLTCIEFPSA